ncbi:hypothetical protein [Caballeronia glebae]
MCIADLLAAVAIIETVPTNLCNASGFPVYATTLYVKGGPLREVIARER